MANGFDLQQEAHQVLLGLEKAEERQPTTSVLFRRTKRLICGVLGKVPGYSVLLQLWHAVLALRQEANKDPQIGSAHIIVRVPGREANTAMFIRFEVIDDAPHEC